MSDFPFTDISSEIWREYRFAAGEVVRIENPLKLHVSGSRGHRVLDAQGISHYIPFVWIHLRWKVRPGQPAFVC